MKSLTTAADCHSASPTSPSMTGDLAVRSAVISNTPEGKALADCALTMTVPIRNSAPTARPATACLLYVRIISGLGILDSGLGIGT